MLGAAKNGPESGQTELRYRKTIFSLSLYISLFFFRPLTGPVTLRAFLPISSFSIVSPPGLDGRYLYFSLLSRSFAIDRDHVSHVCVSSTCACTFLFFPFLSVMQNWSVQHRSVDRKSWTVRYYVESRNKDVFSLSRS